MNDAPRDFWDQLQSRLSSLLPQLISNPALLPTVTSPFLAGYIVGWNIQLDSWRDASKTERTILSLALGAGLTIITAVLVLIADIVFGPFLVGNEYIVIVVILGLIAFAGAIRIVRSGLRRRRAYRNGSIA